MPNLFDFIRQNNAVNGENMGMAAALQAQAAGQDPTAGAPQNSPAPIAPNLAKAATGTDTNMATGAPIDLATAQRVYQQNKQMTGAMSDDTEAKLTAAAQAGNFPTLYKYLPDDGKKLLDKMQKNGALGFGDAAKLNGIMTGALKTVDNLNQQKAQASAIQAQGLANSSAGMNNQLQQAQLAPQLAALQRMQGLSQAQSGVGSGVLSPQAQNALQGQLSDPGTRIAAQYFGMTGKAPPPELLERIRQQQREVKQPIGVVSAGVETGKDSGIPQFDLYNQVYQKGDGSIEKDNTPLRAPAGQPQQFGPQLDPNNGYKPITGSTLAAKGMGASAKPVILTDAQQKAVADANDDLHSLNQTGQSLAPMLSAIQEYTKGQSTGGGTNNVMGSKYGSMMRQWFGDNSGAKLDAASGGVVPQIMAQTKGLRSQKEFDAVTSMVPEKTDSNSVLQMKGQYWVQAHQANVNYAQSYKDALSQGMSVASAKEAATKQAPLPSIGGTDTQSASAPPAGAAQANQPSGPMPTVSTADQYAALPKGSLYRTPKGAMRVK